MKRILLASLIASAITQALSAQQFTPPPGAKGQADKAEAEILKVYSMEDQGATFRAYLVKYKGNDVIVGDDLATSTKNVGDKITFLATRVELPFGGKTIRTLSFKIMNVNFPKK